MRTVNFWNLINLLLFVPASLFTFCSENKDKVTDRVKKIDHTYATYSVTVLIDQSGWKYQIYKREKLVIDQSVIPAAEGHQKFDTYEDAKNVG